MESRCEVVEVPGGRVPRCRRDPDDDGILAAVTGAVAACIVTGDEDLPAPGEHESIPILRPVDFWRFESERLRSPGQGFPRRFQPAVSRQDPPAMNEAPDSSEIGEGFAFCGNL